MDSSTPKKKIDPELSRYFSTLAKASHGKIRERYGGEQGYRDHMREIASRPRKKRNQPYDTNLAANVPLSTALPLDGAGDGSVGGGTDR